MKEISEALALKGHYVIEGQNSLPSCYAVSDLAAASIAAVGEAIAQLVVDLGLAPRVPIVRVNRSLASRWFSFSIDPFGWSLPPVWDSIAGDYRTRDGWIKLHTNLAHHRDAALGVLDARADRAVVTDAVKSWDANELESEIVASGGVAAALRSSEEWLSSLQGRSVAVEPLIHWQELRGQCKAWPCTRSRPLQGLRVLDLTRVLAGPVATRTLAGFGANVLRIDPPGWDEANIVPEITLGKRCATLSLTNADDRATFETLLKQADVLVHGYRPGALDGLGYTQEVRRQLSPNLVEVSLDAYGWTGPWATRRGFDSLVQMSCGIAHQGMIWSNADKPTPLPVQALDFATGYIMAAAVIRALSHAVTGSGLSNARLSLARTAALLQAHPQQDGGTLTLEAGPRDYSETDEKTPWGTARRLRPALSVEGTLVQWDRPACNLGSSKPLWS